MHKRSSRGFTLIELLVVIAIIGILSAVVLASLNTARSKGQDAAIQSDLSTVQTQAEIYYGSTAGNNSYGVQNFGTGATCTSGTGMFSDTSIRNALTGALNASGGTATNVACYSTATSYGVAVKMVSNSPQWWCIDYTGNAKAETGASPGQVFPTAAFTCQ